MNKSKAPYSSFGSTSEPDQRLTISAGVAASDGSTTSPQMLVAVADERLYAAKRNGRNCVQPEL